MARDWSAGEASDRAKRGAEAAGQPLKQPMIKPENRGSFTRYAKQHGKSVKQMTGDVLAHKDQYPPKIVKKANFSRNFGGN